MSESEVSAALDQLKGLAQDYECGVCSKRIQGGEHFIKTASGTPLHPSCFVCCECNADLIGAGYMEKEGKHYCEDHYYEQFGDRCAKCMELFRGQTYVNAMDKKWHDTCFVCAACGSPFESAFAKFDGRPYCAEHIPTYSCAACGGSLSGEVVQANEARYHKACFVCAECKQSIAGVEFFKMDGKMLCAKDYHHKADQAKQTAQANRAQAVPRGDGTCHKCKKELPAQGQYLNVGSAYFHSECWQCSKCDTPLPKSKFIKLGDLFLCEGCADSVEQEMRMKRLKQLAQERVADTSAEAPVPTKDTYVPPSERDSGVDDTSGYGSYSLESAPAEVQVPQSRFLASTPPSRVAPTPTPTPAPAQSQAQTTAAVPNNRTAKFCGDCGKPRDPHDARFCGDCGRKWYGASADAPSASSEPTPVIKPDVTPTPAPSPMVQPVPSPGVAPVNADADSDTVFPYSALRRTPYPPGVDAKNRQNHLSSEEFASVLGVSKAEYEQLPRWKQDNLRKKAGLF